MNEIIGALPTIGAILILQGLLSVDNALAIAALVGRLPDKQRSKALIAGFAGALVFRIAALLLADHLLAYPWLKLVASGYLVYLMCKSLGRDEASHNLRDTNGFWPTVFAVQFTDVAFSIDNVVATVAFSSQMWIIYTGVIAGMVFMFGAASVVGKLLKKYPTLNTVAYLLLGYVGIQLAVTELTGFEFHQAVKIGIVLAFVVVGIAHDRSPMLQKLFARPYAVLVKVMGFVADCVDFVLSPVRFVFRHMSRLFTRRGKQ